MLSLLGALALTMQCLLYRYNSYLTNAYFSIVYANFSMLSIPTVLSTILQDIFFKTIGTIVTKMR